MDQPVIGRSAKVELTIDQLVELQPGLGRLMPEVSRRFWILYHAARGGNWDLADYQRRQMAHLLNVGSTTRPHMAKHLQAFLKGALRKIEEALRDRDDEQFERAFREAVDVANEFHRITGHPEIRWRLPATPPQELDLTSGEDRPAE